MFPEAKYVNFVIRDSHKLYFIGDGIYVTKNLYGYSLRAGRKFEEGEWITQYGGILLSSKQMNALTPGEDSHVKGGIRGGQGLNGYKTPVQGMPGGSFVNNDSVNPNAKLVTETNGVFLRAIKVIGMSSIIKINYYNAKGHSCLE